MSQTNSPVPSPTHPHLPNTHTRFTPHYFNSRFFTVSTPGSGGSGHSRLGWQWPLQAGVDHLNQHFCELLQQAFSGCHSHCPSNSMKALKRTTQNCYSSRIFTVCQNLPAGCPYGIPPPTTTVLRPFFQDHPGEPVPEENFWILWCKGRLTEADKLPVHPE